MEPGDRAALISVELHSEEVKDEEKSAVAEKGILAIPAANNLGTVNSFMRNAQAPASNTPKAADDEGKPLPEQLKVPSPNEPEAKLLDSVQDWHVMPAMEALATLATSSSGLSKQEAGRRLHAYGPNRMTEAKKTSFWKRLWAQLNNVVVYILFVAFIVSAVLKEWAEVGLIIGVIVVNVVIGLVQEGNAEKAAQAIKAMLTSNALVVRAGQRIAVEAETLVPGDVVFIQSGDRVPADLRLFDVSHLQCLEAMLTGESLPVSKHCDIVKIDASLGDRKNMAYSATMVVKGQALGVVIGTGDRTEIGKINQMLGNVEEAKSNILKQMDIVGRWIAVVVFIIGAISLILALLPPNNESVGVSFTIAVTIAVAIIPEGLPTMLTITLAIAVSKMAKKNAIVRQLPCVETLGSVNVICSDKTGTLTKNEMTVTKICTKSAEFEVSGIGYDPSTGKVNSSLPEEHLRDMLLGAVLCNDSNLVSNAPGSWVPVGDPTEVALLTLSHKAGISVKPLRDENPRLKSIPFESENKFMASLHKSSSSQQYVMHVKGAPDKLINYCSHQIAENMAEEIIDKEYWINKASDMSGLGLRVLAICSANLSEEEFQQLPAGVSPEFITGRNPCLTIKMLVAIIDPPRDECIEAIKVAHSAGIVVKMITGDHAKTALAIGNVLGLVDEEHKEVITGPEMDKLSDEDLAKLVTKCNIFARSSPENKIRIVRALQENRLISSMTGDGVNDAPALRAADIGVAMGITGTDVSKEAAKIILADDNFATILEAVKVGRQVWDNLRKILLYNQPCNFAQGVSIMMALALGVPRPLSTIQVLYVNLITAVTMGLMLAAEPPEEGIMLQKPRRVGKQLIGKKFLWRSIFVSAILIVFVLVSYQWGETLGYTFLQKQAISFNTLVFGEIAYAFTCRFGKLSAFHPRIFRGNIWCFVSVTIASLLQVFIVYTPYINTFFSTEPLDAQAWGIIMLFAVLTFIIVEIEKALIDPFVNPILLPVFLFLKRRIPSFLRFDKQ